MGDALIFPAYISIFHCNTAQKCKFKSHLMTSSKCVFRIVFIFQLIISVLLCKVKGPKCHALMVWCKAVLPQWKFWDQKVAPNFMLKLNLYLRHNVKRRDNGLILLCTFPGYKRLYLWDHWYILSHRSQVGVVDKHNFPYGMLMSTHLKK